MNQSSLPHWQSALVVLLRVLPQHPDVSPKRFAKIGRLIALVEQMPQPRKPEHATIDISYTTPEDASCCTRIVFDRLGITVEEHAFFTISEEFRSESSSLILAHYRFGTDPDPDGDGAYFIDLKSIIMSTSCVGIRVE